jgi:putative ABC transport system permease protein
MTTGRWQLTSEKLYAALWWTMPADFRRAHSRDAVELFRDLYRDAVASGGRSAVAGLWARSFVRIVSCAVRERWDTLFRRQAPHTPPKLTGPGRPRRSPKVFETLLQDMRYAIRSFINKPGFSLTAIAIVALGVGATTTIFSVVDGVLLEDLPYPDPEELVFVANPGHPVPVYVDWRDRTDGFSVMAGVRPRDRDLTGDGPPVSLETASVTPHFFRILGTVPLRGRLFLEEDFDGPANVAVLSHAAWQQRWGGDPGILGRTITLDAEPVVVVGVLSADFEPPEVAVSRHVDVWLPFDVADPGFNRRDRYVLRVLGRLGAGVTLQSVQAEFDVLAEALAIQYPEQHRLRDGSARLYPLVPMLQATTGNVARSLYMLLGAVGLMLLIACANVANLFLARGTERQREMALRTALGAGRGRIIGQMLTESILLSVVAGGVGVIIATLGVNVFEAYNSGGIPRIDGIAVNVRVLSFALAISAATGVAFGILPAMHAAKSDVNDTLIHGASTAPAARGQFTMRNALIVTEIAVALVLLVGAGLLFNSFVRLRNVDSGFESDNVLTMSLELGPTYTGEQRLRFVENLTERIAGLPGVEDVGAGTTQPLDDGPDHLCCWRTRVHPVPETQIEAPLAIIHPVTPGYLRVLQADVVAGRGFIAADAQRATPPVVLSAGLAERLFGRDDAAGEQHTLRIRDTDVEVVGVVKDIRHWGLHREENFNVYVPHTFFGGVDEDLAVGVKTYSDNVTLARALRQAVWALQPDQPVDQIVSMRRLVAESVTEPRFYSLLVTTFATIALLLAAGGIYGSVLYTVSQRQRELGIRMALGAEAADVVRLIVRHGALLVLLGLGIGITGAVVATRVLRSLLFDITATDPVTFGGVALLLGAAAIAACYVPARQASRADPMVTLRNG